ncbi:MAG: hypothetical protein K6B41_14545 [Butyrivibrio sp.]|nr:hypothetical protein [Butyrivibrio sp.]
MKYSDEIVKQMDDRGPVEIPDGCFASEEFDEWMYGSDDDCEYSRTIWSIFN